MRKVTFAAVVVLAASASFGAVSAVTNGDQGPPPPPWISRDGAVDISKAPARISVGLPDDLMSKSPDGWGWVDSNLLLALRSKSVVPVYVMPVYPTQDSDFPIGYFDRGSGRVTSQDVLELPVNISVTTEVAK